MTKDNHKSYVDELAEWVKEREKTRPRQDKHVVAFLAVRSDIEAAIDAGYSLKTIWEHQHERGVIPYRYETFLRHVKRYIHAKPAKTSSLSTPATTSGSPVSTPSPTSGRPSGQGEASGQTNSPAPSPVAPSGPTAFVFNPTPNREDLI
jgi:hypothetical protein